MGQIVHIYAAAQEERPSCSAAALQRRTMRMSTGLSLAAIPLPVCLPDFGPALVLYVCGCLLDSRTALGITGGRVSSPEATCQGYIRTHGAWQVYHATFISDTELCICVSRH